MNKAERALLENLEEEHAILEKRYHLLKKREDEIDADDTMSEGERVEALAALAEDYRRLAVLMGEITEVARLLKAQVQGDDPDGE